MTGQERDYEAVLSRVLRTTTDQFEPVGDGLAKIRARLGEPWLSRQWWLLRGEFMMFRWFVVVRCESLFAQIRSRSGAAGLAPDAAARQEADGPMQSLLSLATVTSAKPSRTLAGSAMAWLRPALAVAGAVVLVVAGVFAFGSIRTAVGYENATGSYHAAGGHQFGPGSPNGTGQLRRSGTSPTGGSRASSAGPATARGGTAASATPCSAAKSPAQHTPSPPPTSASPTPSTQSPTPSPSPSQTSASPTPSTSQAPMAPGVPGHTEEAIGTTALVLCVRTPGNPSPPNQAPTGP